MSIGNFAIAATGLSKQYRGGQRCLPELVARRLSG